MTRLIVRSNELPVSRQSLRFLSLIVLIGAVASLVGCAKSQQRLSESRACGNCMISIDFAARLYAEEHDGYLPSNLFSMSNELVAPKILVCPGDRSHTPAASWAMFVPTDSSYEIATKRLRVGETNRVFLRCKVHGHVGYGDGSVFIDGKRHRKS